MPTRRLVTVVVATVVWVSAAGESARSDELIGHWPLAGDAEDRSGNANHAVNRGVDLRAGGPDGKAGSAAAFNGRDGFLEVPPAPSLGLGTGDFSIAVWVNCQREADDVPGDIVSQYDPARRRGFHLTLASASVTASQASARQLQFGIDDDRESVWTDCGRPGNAVLAFALAVHDGQLYAGTCEPGKEEAGHVYRYAGGAEWVDCGSPAPCNAVHGLVSFDGQLYAGVGKYRLAGSALPESENPHLGGRVFRGCMTAIPPDSELRLGLVWCCGGSTGSRRG